MTARVLIPENDVARTMMAALKAGVSMTGKVCGLTSKDGENFARVALQIPLIGDRIILVRSLDFKVGESVMVRTQLQPGSKYKFVVERAEQGGERKAGEQK